MTATEITPARAELVELLAAARPDWDRRTIERALWDAQNAGVPFDRILTVAVRVLLDLRARPDAIPRQAHLGAGINDGRPLPAEQLAARAAEARAAISRPAQETP